MAVQDQSLPPFQLTIHALYSPLLLLLIILVSLFDNRGTERIMALTLTIGQQQHASGASQPQTYSDLFAPKPMAYWYPSQSSNNNLNSNGSASYTPYQPKEPPRPFSESQQQNSTVVDQPTSGQSSNMNVGFLDDGSTPYN